jgi:hypothetical protein
VNRRRRKTHVLAASIERENKIKQLIVIYVHTISPKELCMEAVSINSRTTGALLLNNGKLVAEYLRPDSIIPEQNRLSELFLQAEIMTSVPLENRDLFGGIHYVMISHGKLDIWLFPIVRELEDAATTLAIGITGKYRHDKFLEKIKKILIRYYSIKEKERISL